MKKHEHLNIYVTCVNKMYSDHHTSLLSRHLKKDNMNQINKQKSNSKLNCLKFV